MEKVEQAKLQVKKRAKGDDQLHVAKAALTGLDADQSSLENNTNFDWKRRRKEEGSEHTRVDMMTKPILVQGEGEEIEAHQFYEQSLYFVDTLQQEFCTITNDNWIEFKEPVPLDFLDDWTADPQMKEGKWEPEEHARFLEALKLFGKDWDKIQKHVNTRGVKNIRSHAQKFLVKLVRNLEKGKAIQGLTESEVSYFYGVLNKRVHRSTIERQHREELGIKTKQPELIFKIEKEPRKLQEKLEEKFEEALQLSDDQKKPLTTYEKWSASHAAASFSFSIKARTAVLQEAVAGASVKMCKFSFKSMVEVKSDFSLSSGDSADSQSHRHHEKYSLDEYFTPAFRARVKNFEEQTEAIEEFMRRHYIEIFKKGDLPSRDLVLSLQIGKGGPVFDMVRQTDKVNYLSELHGVFDSRVISRLPNIYANNMAIVQELMEEGSEGKHMPDFDKFVYSLALDDEGCDFLRKSKFELSFVTAEEQEKLETEFNRPYTRVFGEKNDELLTDEEIMSFLNTQRPDGSSEMKDQS